MTHPDYRRLDDWLTTVADRCRRDEGQLLYSGRNEVR